MEEVKHLEHIEAETSLWKILPIIIYTYIANSRKCIHIYVYIDYLIHINLFVFIFIVIRREEFDFYFYLVKRGLSISII